MRPLLCSHEGTGPGRGWLLESPGPCEGPSLSEGLPLSLTSTLLLPYHLEIWSGLWQGKGTYSFL